MLKVWIAWAAGAGLLYVWVLQFSKDVDGWDCSAEESELVMPVQKRHVRRQSQRQCCLSLCSLSDYRCCNLSLWLTFVVCRCQICS